MISDSAWRSARSRPARNWEFPSRPAEYRSDWPTSKEAAVPSPLSPEPIATRSIDALPPYVSNGVVGIRYPALPHLPGTTMVNGFAGVNLDDGVEGFARAPFALATDVQLDGVWASAAPEWTQLIHQGYDFATAELHSTWTFTVGGTTATVDSLVFCPRSVPSLAVCQLTVRVDAPAALVLAAGIDPADVPGSGVPTRLDFGTRAEAVARRTRRSGRQVGGVRGSAWPGTPPRGQPRDLERTLEGADHRRRCRRPLAADHRREHLLPPELGPRL